MSRTADSASKLLAAIMMAMQAHPDQRLCQIIENALAKDFQHRECCIFHVTDEDLRSALKRYRQPPAPTNGSEGESGE